MHRLYKTFVFFIEINTLKLKNKTLFLVILNHNYLKQTIKIKTYSVN